MQSLRYLLCLVACGLGLLAGCGRPPPTLEETLAAAETFLALGEFAPAVEKLEAFDERAPGHPAVIETLAEAYAGMGDFALAAFNYLRLADMDPDEPLPLLFAASAMREGGDVAGALNAYRRYLDARPADVATARAVATLQLERGDRMAAIDTLLRSNRAAPRGSTMATLGRLFLEARNLGQAQDWFVSALEANDESRPEALLGLMETALVANRMADAEALLKQIDAEFPGAFNRSALAPKRRELAEWRRRQDEAREAAAALTRAREREAQARAAAEAAATPPEPEPPPTVVRPADPAPAPQVPATPPPPPPDSPAGRAAAALAAGDFPAAIRHFREALLVDRENPDLWMGLSEAQLRNGEADWAVSSASEAMRRRPQDVRPLLQYLRAGQQAFPPERLIREMEQAKRRFPQSAEVTLALARAYRNVGNNPRGARIFYNEFLSLAPADHPDRPAAERELASL